MNNIEKFNKKVDNMTTSELHFYLKEHGLKEYINYSNTYIKNKIKERYKYFH